MATDIDSELAICSRKIYATHEKHMKIGGFTK